MKLLLASLITFSTMTAFAGNIYMGINPYDFAEGGKPVVGMVRDITIFPVDPSIAQNEASLFVQGGNNTSCSISESVVKTLGMDLGQLAMILQSGNFDIYCLNDPSNGMKTTKVIQISQ